MLIYVRDILIDLLFKEKTEKLCINILFAFNLHFRCGHGKIWQNIIFPVAATAFTTIMQLHLWKILFYLFFLLSNFRSYLLLLL